MCDSDIKSVCDVSRKRRGHSVCSLEEDLMCPVGICLSARVPARALQVLVTHETYTHTRYMPYLERHTLHPESPECPVVVYFSDEGKKQQKWRQS